MASDPRPFQSVTVTLAYFRHNRTQAGMGQSFDVSQSTISRAISAITPLIEEGWPGQAPTADELMGTQYIVDGTLLPCWSWAAHPGLYSGKHKTTGMNVQVGAPRRRARLDFRSGRGSPPRRNYCLGESGVLQTLIPENWTGDKGYVGNEMITPVKKPAGAELLDWQKEFNAEVDSIRWVIERAIAHVKNWRIMHADSRRPINTFATTISAAVGLQLYRMA